MVENKERTLTIEVNTVTTLVTDERKTRTWQWREWDGLPYLTCSLLEDWSHGFFTRQYHPRPPETFVGALHTEAEVYRVKQVHGDRVVTPTEIQREETAEADGILTESPNQAVWVASADCTPVLIGDRATGRAVAIHSGWRGTAKRIVPGAIDRLVNSGSELENLSIALGPAIAGEVYQVSTEVAAEVGASLFPDEGNEGTMLERLFDLPDSPLHPDPEPGKVRLDVRSILLHQLRQLGIDDDRIAIAPFCTYQQGDRFFSYRREREKKIQWSGIVSR
ncbi:peptidoglycan editing factor PgeF [Pannus brasiliensis]